MSARRFEKVLPMLPDDGPYAWMASACGHDTDWVLVNADAWRYNTTGKPGRYHTLDSKCVMYAAKICRTCAVEVGFNPCPRCKPEDKADA